MLEPGGTLIINTDAFDERNLAKAGYDANPLERRHSLKGYTVYEVPMTTHHQGGVWPTSASSPATPSGRRTSSPSA